MQIEKIIKHGYKEIYVIGHSMGGTLILSNIFILLPSNLKYWKAGAASTSFFTSLYLLAKYAAITPIC